MIGRNPVNGRNAPEVVVVTGAGAGLGRAIVQSFARRGAHIGLISRGRERLQDAKQEAEMAGGKALVLPADVADAGAVEAAAAETEQEFGPIDIWINDAMTTVFSPVKEMTPDEFKRVTEVTYLGFVYGTLAALKRMLPRDRGTIVQVGSALAYRSIPLQSAYCAAKHAMVGFTDSLRSELIHDGSHVRVTVVHMPALNTPQFEWCKSNMPRKAQPVPPIFQPELAAEAILWAARTGRPEIYVGWPTIKAIIGNKIAPRLADWYLARNGYAAQQTDQPVAPNRPDNLWLPLTGDYGAHGEFDARARPSSWHFRLSKNRNWLSLATLFIAGAFLASTTASHRSQGRQSWFKRFCKPRLSQKHFR